MGRLRLISVFLRPAAAGAYYLVFRAVLRLRCWVIDRVEARIGTRKGGRARPPAMLQAVAEAAGYSAGWYNTTWHLEAYVRRRLGGLFAGLRYKTVPGGLQDIVFAWK